MTDTYELPELPQTTNLLGKMAVPDVFTADQMKEYARLAVKAERERLAAQWEHRHGFDKYGVAAAIRKG